MLDLWAWDFARLTLTRLTFASGLDSYPVWTPDGRRLLFASIGNNPGGISTPRRPMGPARLSD
jgi:Tol biopolymer transport system component